MNITKMNTITLTLLIAALAIISSCSGDDDGDEICLPGIAELSSESLGVYNGILTLNGTAVVNPAGTATLTSTSCKTYDVSFSDDVPSITGLKFIASNNETVFTFTNTTATTTVVLNGDGRLTVAKTDAPVITFTGTK